MKFNLFGVRVKISFAFVAFVSLAVIVGGAGKLIFCIISVFIHEAGHITAMCLWGYKPQSVELKPFNIVITDANRQYQRDFCTLTVILSGPFANIIAGTIFAVFGRYFNIEWMCFFSAVNIATAVFNLIPASNLDGGQAVYLLLRKRFTPEKSDKIITALTIAVFLPAFFFGFLILFVSKYNFSLLLLSLYLLLSIFIKENKYY